VSDEDLATESQARLRLAVVLVGTPTLGTRGSEPTAAAAANRCYQREQRGHVMPRLLVVIVTVLLLAVNASAEVNKSNSLAVDKDAITGSWTATCDISVSGVDERQIYSGRMLFQFLSQGAGSATTVFDILFQVDPTDRVWTDSSPRIYSVKATLRRRQVAVHAEVAFESISPGDRLFCHSRIDPGTQPPVVGTTLFGADMDSTIQQP
jgi:hypothetical protein